MEEAKTLLRGGQQEAARQRFAHAQSFKAQNLSLMRAVTAMHAQQLSMKTHEANVLLLATLKATARHVHHKGIDPDAVDAVTESLNDASDYAAVSNGMMAGLGDELTPVHDEAWDAFLAGETGPVRPERALAAEPQEDEPTQTAEVYSFPSAPNGALPAMSRGELAPKCTGCGETHGGKCRPLAEGVTF